MTAAAPEITIVRKLTRKHRVHPGLGGGSVSTDANGKTTATSYVTDDGKRLVNPDGPEAAALIEELVEALTGLLKAARAEQPK